MCTEQFPMGYLIKKGKLKTCPSQKLNWEVITKISHLKTNSDFYQCTWHSVTAWKGHIAPSRQEANWCCFKPCNRNWCRTCILTSHPKCTNDFWTNSQSLGKSGNVIISQKFSISKTALTSQPSFPRKCLIITKQKTVTNETSIKI